MTGAAVIGSAAQASGMWPSPASSPEVGSSPTQPAPGKVDLGPGVQVGEVGLRPRRAVERGHVRLELDQVTRDEPGRQPELPQELNQQPGRVAARAAAQRQRLLAGLDARLQADEVADLLVEAAIELDDVIDGPDLGLREARSPAPGAAGRPARSPGRESARGRGSDRRRTGNCSAASSMKKSNGLITVISATRSTSTVSSLTGLGKTSRAR